VFVVGDRLPRLLLRDDLRFGRFTHETRLVNKDGRYARH
jgi:hypothetical protein